MTENLSAETLADASLKSAADGGATVESPALTLAELNKHLGADFKDPSTALKALKDTKDFVGKRKEDIANELRQSVVVSNPSDVASKSDVQALKNELFYSQNPQYKEFESTLSKISSDPAEAVNDEGFKSLFGKARVADEVTSNKSVVQSNNRISQVKSVTDSAISVANARGTTMEDVASIFARAINEENNS